MSALILPLKKHTAWWSPAYTSISNGWQFIVNITDVHASPHPFPPSSKLDLTTWRQFRLIATASSSVGSDCQSLPFECAVARATGVKSMLLCCHTHLHLRELCQHLSSHSWDGFNAFLPRSSLSLLPVRGLQQPAFGKQLLLLCRSTPAREWQMAAAKLGMIKHRGCCYTL